jgi:hypothetical protein
MCLQRKSSIGSIGALRDDEIRVLDIEISAFSREEDLARYVRFVFAIDDGVCRDQF